MKFASLELESRATLEFFSLDLQTFYKLIKLSIKVLALRPLEIRDIFPEISEACQVIYQTPKTVFDHISKEQQQSLFQIN